MSIQIQCTLLLQKLHIGVDFKQVFNNYNITWFVQGKRLFVLSVVLRKRLFRELRYVFVLKVKAGKSIVLHATLLHTRNVLARRAVYTYMYHVCLPLYLDNISTIIRMTYVNLGRVFIALDQLYVPK